MSASRDAGAVPERRASPRFRARCAARLQFITRITEDSDFDDELWPSLICRTRDVSEAGLSLVVPGVREGDDIFFGVEGPVRVTLGLPTGAVEVGAVAARYARESLDEEGGGFLVCVRLTEMSKADAERFGAYLQGLDRVGGA